MPNYGPAIGGNEVLLMGASFDPFLELENKFRELAINENFKFVEADRMNKNDTFCVFEKVAKTKAVIISST